jgi:cytochrome oxidase Cu insertion factor (SCO1/SenC/PrrC family)
MLSGTFGKEVSPEREYCLRIFALASDPIALTPDLTHRRYTLTMLAEGTTAPEFTLPDQHGDRVSLSDFRGRWLVLFWFPKAFTSG